MRERHGAVHQFAAEVRRREAAQQRAEYLGAGEEHRAAHELRVGGIHADGAREFEPLVETFARELPRDVVAAEDARGVGDHADGPVA